MGCIARRVTVLLSNGRAHVENTETRERRDNLVPLALLVEEEALETTDPRETLYVKYTQQINLVIQLVLTTLDVSVSDVMPLCLSPRALLVSQATPGPLVNSAPE